MKSSINILLLSAAASFTFAAEPAKAAATAGLACTIVPPFSSSIWEAPQP
jgi:hypothetical protein